MTSILKYSLLVLLILFITIQFFRVDRSIAIYDSEADFLETYTPPSEVESIFKTACYDCHSYETEYPWYSDIQPISWWLQDHVEEGRDEMNLSVWTEYSFGDADHLLEEMMEMVDEHEMPLQSYTLVHSEARLTDQQRETFIDWISELRSSLQQANETSNSEVSE